MSRPLTVLQVVPALDVGGAEKTCVEIADAMMRRGGRTLAAGAPGRLVASFEAAGGTFCSLPLLSKNPFAIYANAGRLARLIADEGVDIIHARSRAPAWSALIAARRTGRPFVTTYHGIYGERSAAKRLYNSVMVRGDMVIANSGFTADLITARYRTPAERLTVIHRGIDPSAFDPGAVDTAAIAGQRRKWGVDEHQPVLLLPGRLTGWKGQEVAIRALAALGDDTGSASPVLVLAGGEQGRSAYRGHLDSVARDCAVADRVVFAGHTPDIATAYAASRIMVSCSTKPEAFGRAIVEAQAMEVPVVVSDLGPVRETVQAPPDIADDRRTGWLVPASDPQALAATLREALSLPEPARREIGMRGRSHVLARFTVDRMTGATLDIYDRLAADMSA